MTTQTQDETSVRVQIVVAAPIERAFRVFTEEFDRIKPREHNLLGVEIAETVFEPRVGGHVYDRGVDGSECRWARVLAYEPPRRVVISWDISPQWQIETDDGATVMFEWHGYGRAYPVGRRQIVGAAFHLSEDERYRRLNDVVCVSVGEVRAWEDGPTDLVVDVAELVWEAVAD